jgi:hypothetical protein
MATTRIDFFRKLDEVKRDTFSDFFTDFVAHPVTGNLGRITDADSIKQSLKNLIYTNYGERLYQPNIGSNVFKSLFELDDMFIGNDIKYHIQKTITDNEPRVNLQDVRIDLDADNNYVNVTIVYNVINITGIQTLYVSLQRAR